MEEKTISSRDIKRQRVLKEFLPLAGFDGWNEATLTKAAVAAGLPPLEGKRLFPGGITEVMEYYAEMLNTELEQLAAEAGLPAMRVHERIMWLVNKRFTLMEPHKEAIRRAAAFSALPFSGRKVLSSVWQLSDRIWWLAGDTSTDFNHYTKRFLLSKVILTTSLYWLNDDSPHHEDSQAFLERRIHEVLKIGKSVGQAQQRLSQMVENAADQVVNRNRYRTKRR